MRRQELQGRGSTSLMADLMGIGVGGCTIGRGSHCDLVVRCGASVREHHATLIVSKGNFGKY